MLTYALGKLLVCKIMEKENSLKKSKRTARTIEEEIAQATEKLRHLQQRKKEQIRKDRERNYKMIIDLIKTERLDGVQHEKWKEALPKIKALLST